MSHFKTDMMGNSVPVNHFQYRAEHNQSLGCTMPFFTLQNLNEMGTNKNLAKKKKNNPQFQLCFSERMQINVHNLGTVLKHS